MSYLVKSLVDSTAPVRNDLNVSWRAGEIREVDDDLLAFYANNPAAFTVLSGPNQTDNVVASVASLCWRDLEGPISPKETGAGKPTFATFRGNIKAFAFINGDVVDSIFHMPHDWVKGSDLYIHLHWTHNGTAISGSIVFDHRWSYQKGHNQGVYPSDVAFRQTVALTDINDYPRYGAFISEERFSMDTPIANQIPTGDLEVDGLIKISGVATTIPTVTGGSFFIEYIDIHYQSNNTGTVNKAPNFYA